MSARPTPRSAPSRGAVLVAACTTCCLLACGPTGGPTGNAAGPSAPSSGACADSAPEALPRTVVVERRLAGCSGAGRICLEALDEPGFAVLARVHADGRRERLAGDLDGGTQASDARALRGGGFRYVRTARDGATELVTVDADGAESSRPGGAARPILLGGRSFADPSAELGDLRAELTTEPRANVRLVDTTASGGDGRELGAIDLSEAQPVGRSAYVAADGSSFAVLARDGDELIWLVTGRSGGPVERRRIEDAATAAPLAVGPRLRWIALSSDVRGVLVSGPTRSFTVPASPLLAAAFDPCGRWLYLVSGDPPALLRASLPGGELEALGHVPGWMERLQATPDGSLLVGSTLPGGAGSHHRAAILSPFDGEVVEIALPDDTERVANVF